MIGCLKGKLIVKQPPDIVVEVSGVGYEVQMPMSCFYNLPEIDSDVLVHTHFVVREDAQLLYGFTTDKEKRLFKEIIKANGVGPKLGLAILSGMTAVQFSQSVEQGDVSTLLKLPGVGRKTAERLIIELKDRLKAWHSYDLFNPPPPNTAGVSHISDPKEEALSALLILGYKSAQAQSVIDKVLQPAMSSEQLIKAALKSMV